MNEKIEAVQRMQDYINDHLYEQISFTNLSEAAFFSPWYCARIFKELTGLTPADYIRRLKLSKSALRLRDETCRIIDVAYDLGYGSVDGYQRAFFREFGCNPYTYLQNPIPLSLFTPYGVKFKEPKKEAICMENIKNVFIQTIEKPARKIIIKRGLTASDYFTYCNEVGCDVWGILTSIKSISDEPVSMWLPASYIKPGTSQYVQGVEVALDYNGIIPDGLDVIEMPASKFLIFQSEPFEEEDYCVAIEALQASIEKYDPTVIGYHWDDSNPSIQLEPIGSRGYIELHAVK